eukprot:TRINITY_DN6541_c0_g1_i1.p1 TRINITY_DN6541_c0_g1~~TRINITY_DN6541_c0_g1_i1.p1  ORF type:complete len:643 (+),score=163.19 TRINITY_DN6541_c0_g1_i1:184-2112(+)
MDAVSGEVDPTKEFLRGDAASYAEFPPCTLVEVLDASAERYPLKTAVTFGQAKPQAAKGAERRFRQQWTFREYRDEVDACAKALIRSGLRPHSAVLVCGANHPCWAFSALAAACCGGVAAGVHPTYGGDAVRHIVAHCAASIAFVDTAVNARRFADLLQRERGDSFLVVQWSETASMPAHPRVVSYASFVSAGAGVSEAELAARRGRVKAGHAALLVYTSGTTGLPKGCMLSHDNVLWASHKAFHVYEGKLGSERCVSYLALSHIAALLVDVIVQLQHGGHCHFAAQRGDLMQSLDDVRPTIFFGVPAVWDKLKQRLQEAGPVQQQAPTLRRRLLAAAEARLAAIAPVRRAVAARRVRAALGLDQCRVLLSGASPMRHDTAAYFLSLGLPVHEVYGMSECAGPLAASSAGHHRIGFAGPPLPGVALRVHGGELVCRGRNVMMGYWKDGLATQAALDADGWLHTGDAGRIHTDGLLRVEGRLDEVIRLANGHSVVPSVLERAMLEQLPFASHVVLVGDGRPHLCALLTLKALNGDEGVPSDALASIARGLARSAAATVTEARVCPQYNRHIAHLLNQADVAGGRVHRHAILPRDFTVAAGELTPTLKLMRKSVCAKYSDVIESLYSAEPPPWETVAPRVDSKL